MHLPESCEYNVSDLAACSVSFERLRTGVRSLTHPSMFFKNFFTAVRKVLPLQGRCQRLLGAKGEQTMAAACTSPHHARTGRTVQHGWNACLYNYSR